MYLQNMITGNQQQQHQNYEWELQQQLNPAAQELFNLIEDYTDYVFAPAQVNLQNPEWKYFESNNWLNNNINIEQQQQQQQPSLKEASNDTNGGLKCPYCPRILSAQCYYTQHIKAKHSGERPHHCSTCGKRFEMQDQYKKHLKKHSDTDKAHKCPYCSSSYHHKADLKRHIKSSHTHINENVCDICQKAFARKDHMRKHIETHKRSLI